MIPKQLYDRISSQWDGEVFQTWKRIKKRVPLFEKTILPNLAGRHVLEIGCNAGIYAWHIAPAAKSYIGIDISDNYIRQAQITASYIQGALVTFLHSSLREFASEEVRFDAVFCSFLFYHLSDAEVELFEDRIMPKCDVVGAQIRTRKRQSANSFDFMKAENVEALCRRAGLDCRVHWANWRHTAFASVGTRA